jgi:hypothetical protein
VYVLLVCATALACSAAERPLEERAPPACPANVAIELLDEVLDPTHTYVARRFWVSGGGAAGFLHVDVTVQPHGDLFRWCEGTVASTKACARGPMRWDGNHLTIRCEGGRWETDPYYETLRRPSLPGHPITVTFE